MKYLKLCAAVLAMMGVAATAMPLQVSAQENPPKKSFNVRIVDINAVRAQSKAFTAAMDKIVAYGNKRGEELQKEDQALRDLGAELNRKRTLLAPEKFAEERKAFDERVANFQRAMQEHQQVINKLQVDVLGQLNEKIIKIITEYAQENNVGLILPAQSIVLSADELTIDAVVLERLNKDLPTVAVTLPSK